MPDREAHHHPAEHPHQRDLPCRLLRGRLVRSRRFGASFSTRSSGVRSAAGSRACSGALSCGLGLPLLGVALRDRGATPLLLLLAARRRRPGRCTNSWNSSLEICSPGSCGAVMLPRRVRLRSCAGLHVDGLAPERRRVRRHGAEFAHDPRAAGTVGALAFLPVGQHRRGDEDRRVRARGDPDHQREGEVLQRFPAEQQQRDHRQQRAEARRQRAVSAPPTSSG